MSKTNTRQVDMERLTEADAVIEKLNSRIDELESEIEKIKTLGPIEFLDFCVKESPSLDAFLCRQFRLFVRDQLSAEKQNPQTQGK